MARRRRYETKAQTEAFLDSLRESMCHKWQVGDKCMTYDLSRETTISAINGDIVTVADAGKYREEREMHTTKVRLPSFVIKS